jgi:hypothetical protein
MKKIIYILMLLMILSPLHASASVFDVGYCNLNVYYLPTGIDYADADDNDWKLYDSINLEIGDDETLDYFEILEIATNGENIRAIFDDKPIILSKFDSVYSEDLELKVQLVSLFPKESLDTTTTDYTNSDKIVNIWVELEDGTTKNLVEGKILSFDYSKYEENEDSWWIVEDSEYDELTLFVEKISDADISFGIDTDEIYEENKDGNTIEFTLLTNGLYEFTIDYETIDDWGGITDEQQTFGIKVSGLTEGTKSSEGLSISENLIVGNTIISFYNTESVTVVTNEDGEWTEDNSYSVQKTDNEDGTYSWVLKFAKSGTYNVYFTSVNNEMQLVKFKVSEKETVNVDDTSSSSKVVSSNESSFTDSIKDKGVFIIALICVLVIGILLINDSNKKKKNNSGGSFGGNSDEDNIIVS